MISKITNHLKTFKIIYLLIGFFICLLFDLDVALELSETENVPYRHAAQKITDIALGANWIWGSVIAILFLTVFLKKNLFNQFKSYFLNFRLWFSHLLFAMLSTGIFVALCKFLIGRTRPFAITANSSTFEISPFNLSPSCQSFPSGHTQIIFCVSTMLAILWPKKTVLFFFLALIIAITRVITINHFLSDLYAGMLIGIYGTQFSVRFWSRWVDKPVEFNTSVK